MSDGEKILRKSVLSVMPVKLSVTALLGMFVTGLLFVIELQRWSLLDIPAATAMSGFTTLSAVLSNIWLSALLLGLIAAITCLVAGLVALFYWLSILSAFRSAFLARRARFGLSQLLVSMPRLFLLGQLFLNQLARNKPQISALRQLAERMIPQLAVRRAALEARRRSELRAAYWAFKRRLVRGRRIKRRLANVFIWWTDRSTVAHISRTVVLIAIVALSLLAQRIVIIHQDRMMYVNSSTHDSSRKPFFYELARHSADALNSRYLKFVAPLPRRGSLTLQKPDAATHLAHSGWAKGRPGDAFRTEKIYYIGDFGEWAYVARAANPSERLMIRRSSILEFGRYAAPSQPRNAVENKPKSKTSGGDAIVKLDVVMFPSRSDGGSNDKAPDLSAIEQAIADLGAQQTRTQAMVLHFWRALGTQEPDNEGSPDAELANLRDQQARTQSMVLQFLVAQSDKNPPANPALLDGQSKILDELNRLLIGQQALYQTFPHQHTHVASSDHNNIDRFLDGISTRPRGLRDDLIRRLGPSFLEACSRDPENLLGHVDFAEGSARGQNDDQFHEIWLKAAASHRVPGERILLLRGGASDSGPRALNIALSESRAEWVKRGLLRIASTKSGFAAMSDDVRQTHQLEIVSLGDGERLGAPLGPSPRAVNAFLCRTGPARTELTANALPIPTAKTPNQPILEVSK